MKKIWMITGASSGLGKGIAEAVFRRGDNAVVTARREESLEDLVEVWPDQAFPISLDLSDPNSVKAAVEKSVERFGTIDVLVNNAGHGYRAAVEESEDAAVRELFDVNFFAPMELIKAVLPIMRDKGSGIIVNVTSIGAVRGALGNGYYSAAKGALELATDAMRKETEGFGIRTMLVEPGALRTGFYGGRMAGSLRKIAAYDGFAEKYRKEKIRDDHDQPGDPVRAGEIIVETALRKDAPFRLLIGSDAVKAAEAEYMNRLSELREWYSVSIQSDFPSDQ